MLFSHPVRVSFLRKDKFKFKGVNNKINMSENYLRIAAVLHQDTVFGIHLHLWQMHLYRVTYIYQR